MIAYLKGNLAVKEPNSAILDVSGVGYKVGISLQTYEQLPKTDVDLKLHIYHHITENAQSLFGFYTKDEQRLFELLITVKGVGPKLGLTILSGLPVSDLESAIMNQDAVRLSKIPGIGKKSAERMILELKDKIGKVTGSVSSSTGDAIPQGDLRGEAISALEALGYKRNMAEKAVLKVFPGLDEANKNVSGLIKAALKALA